MSSVFRAGKTWIRQMREKLFQDYVFIHINKTAGSSIEKALGMRFDHKTALEKMAELGPDRWRDRFSFTFVRNPWDKVVSHYHYRRKTNKNGVADRGIRFHEWVQKTYGDQDPEFYDNPKMFLPQWKWITDEEGGVLVDFIGRFERLQEDFQTVCQRLQLEASLPHLKQSKRGPFQDYYDEKTREVVRAWFRLDIENFGYEF